MRTLLALLLLTASALAQYQHVVVPSGWAIQFPRAGGALGAGIFYTDGDTKLHIDSHNTTIALGVGGAWGGTFQVSGGRTNARMLMQRQGDGTPDDPIRPSTPIIHMSATRATDGSQWWRYSWVQSFTDLQGHTGLGFWANASWVGVPDPTKPDVAIIPHGLRVNGSAFISDYGPPEGYVVGSVGDLFTDKHGTNGVVLWVKQSGTNTATGWVAK